MHAYVTCAVLHMCRFSHDAAVWACLAALSMAAGELATAEVAFAAIDAVDKLQYVLHLRSLGGSAAATASGADPLVAAELALYAGQPDEAEAKLLQVSRSTAPVHVCAGTRPCIHPALCCKLGTKCHARHHVWMLLHCEMCVPQCAFDMSTTVVSDAVRRRQ
jgi:hypothetical protein